MGGLILADNFLLNSVPWGTEIGNGGPILAAKIGPAGPILAAKMVRGTTFGWFFLSKSVRPDRFGGGGWFWRDRPFTRPYFCQPKYKSFLKTLPCTCCFAYCAYVMLITLWNTCISREPINTPENLEMTKNFMVWTIPDPHSAALIISNQ